MNSAATHTILVRLSPRPSLSFRGGSGNETSIDPGIDLSCTSGVDRSGWLQDPLKSNSNFKI